MKKKNVIIIVSCLLLGCILYFVLFRSKVVTTITLDINPSIELGLDKNNSVIKAKALNEDAKSIVNKELLNKSLNDALNDIKDNLVKEGYAEDRMVILAYSEGEYDSEEFKNKLANVFRDLDCDILTIDNISSDDIKYAKKNGISPAKAAYINSISNEKTIDSDMLVNKDIEELKETKETGFYCEDGFSLEGGNCVKIISKKAALVGERCPNGYTESNGHCYKNTAVIDTDELRCNEPLTLKDNNCVGTVEVQAIPNFKCEKGTLITRYGAANRDFRESGDPDQMVCEDRSEAVAPTLRCLKGPHIMIDGSCYVGPAPLINGGCPGSDKPVNGGCYSKDPGDQWQCPNGDIYEKSKDTYIDLCPDTFKYTIATGNYECQEGYKLVGNKCSTDISEKAIRVRKCPEGYYKTENDECINYSDEKSKENGPYCEGERERLEGNECVTFEMKEAFHN